jgi:sortase A
MHAIEDDRLDTVPAMARPPRPPGVHDWRWWVGSVGRALIATGLLLLAFVSYQLWGTGLQTSRAQDALAREFDALLAAAPAPTAATTSTVGQVTTVALPTTVAPAEPTASTAPATTAPAVPVPTVPAPDVREGDPLARIEIPRIGVDDITVAGVKVDDLRKGPGHFPDTPLPGQLGNSAIAGHRTTFGAPFNRVDELSPGDEIIVTTVQGRFVYTVTGTSIVAPTALEVLDPTPDATLTLVSCHPKYSARQRIIVKAVLDPTASAEPQPASAPYESSAAEDDPEIDDDPRLTIPGSEDGEADGSGEPTAGGTLATDPASAGGGDAFARGWFSDRSAIAPSVLLALLTLAVYVAGWWVGRRWTRWLWLPFVPVFAVSLFVFFEQFSRLLPPSL